MKTLNRREFLQLGGITAAMTALAACRPLAEGAAAPTQVSGEIAPLEYDGEWLLQRTLQRISFAPTPDEVAHAREIGIDNFIDEQLAPDSLDDSHMEAILAPYSTLQAEPAELIDSEQPYMPLAELTAATLLRGIYSRRQLYEMVVDFWSNHFNIYFRKGIVRAFKTADDRHVIRPHVLGKLQDLLLASAKSPAMLIYLDNAQSTADRPNENYARELLELHTLGVNGGYTQFDVQEMARAFTGWGISRLRGRRGQPGEFYFDDQNHDSGEKLILGATIPANGGIGEGEQIIAMLAEHPSTAEFISYKLAQRFVADEPPTSIVSAAAATFSASRGDIALTLGTILHSEEFKASLGTKLKRPLEVFLSALRSTGATLAEISTRGSGRNGNRRGGRAALADHLSLMGQPLFLWETPDGYPDYAAAWASTNGTLARWNYALAVAYDQGRSVSVDWAALAGDATDNTQALDALTQRLLGGRLPDEAQAIILNFVGAAPLETSLPAMGALILSSPFFQYR